MLQTIQDGGYYNPKQSGQKWNTWSRYFLRFFDVMYNYRLKLRAMYTFTCMKRPLHKSDGNDVCPIKGLFESTYPPKKIQSCTHYTTPSSRHT